MLVLIHMKNVHIYLIGHICQHEMLLSYRQIFEYAMCILFHFKAQTVTSIMITGIPSENASSNESGAAVAVGVVAALVIIIIIIVLFIICLV